MSELKRLNPLNDSLVKYIFATPERKDITISLINAFFEYDGTETIADIEFLSERFGRERDSEKESFLDIRAKTSQGTLVNIEIQVANLSAMGERSLYYWSEMFVHALDKGEPYEALPRTVCLNILDYILFENEIAPAFHNKFALMNTKIPGHTLTDCLEIHFVELPKWNARRKENQSNSELDQWMKYFSKKTGGTELEALAMQNPMIQKALEAEHFFSADEVKMHEYLIAEKNYRDRISFAHYYAKQRKEGREEGLAEGRAEGRAEGIEKNKFETAQKMLAMELPLDAIKAVTGYTVDTLKKIAQENHIDYAF